MKNQIDRFNSQRDLSNAVAPVHHDIDMSQDGRPILKLDAEASFRYVSNGPRISPSTNVQAESDVSDDLVPDGTQSVKKFPLRAKVEADTGSEDDDEIVAPYEEDKVRITVRSSTPIFPIKKLTKPYLSHFIVYQFTCCAEE